MELEDVRQIYEMGYDCAQAVLYAFKDKVDGDFESEMRTISCMSMGLLEGSICGAVLGALAVIGLKYGCADNDPARKGLAIIKRAQFMMEYHKMCDGLTCPEIIKLDVRKNEDNLKAYQTGIYDHFCPDFCLKIINIVEKVIA